MDESKFILLAGTFLVSSLLPLASYSQISDKNKEDKTKTEQKSQSREITEFYGDQYLNPFIQPNLLNEGNFDLSYYGSGDINDDNVIDWTDYNLILGSTNDRADVDGNGIPGQQPDKNLLLLFKIDGISYLPAHWELLQTTAEKESWLQKVLAIDLTNLPHSGWDCNDYSLQSQINLSGVENIENSGIDFNEIDSTDNARFNLPVYLATTITLNNIPHRINAAIVGDSTNSFNDWYFFEPQNDTRVFPGTPSMHPDSHANIKKFVYFWSTLFNQYDYNTNKLIDFDLQAGQVVNISPSTLPELVLYKPENLSHVHIGGNKPNDITVNFEQGTDTTITGNVTGNASWSEVIYSDSTNQTTGLWDYTHYNYNLWREWKANSLEHALIDTTYGSLNPFYNRAPQLITVQDTANPVNTWHYGGAPMPFTEWLGGIPESQFTDNSGVWDYVRTITSNRGSNPDSCNFYEFLVNVSDSAYDPSGNSTIVEFSVPVYLNENQWLEFPNNSENFYGEELTPPNTGGYATAFNPAGVGVGVTYSDISGQIPDSTSCGHYNYLITRTWLATDSVCGNFIDSVQNINVIEPFPPLWSYVPADTIIETGENMHPDNLGWAVAEDTISNVTPPVSYSDELIEEVPNVYRLWKRNWSAYDICGDFAPDTASYITEDISISIPEKPKTLEDKLKVYPNPSMDLVFLDYHSEFDSEAIVSVLTASGDIVYQVRRKVSKGDNHIHLNLGWLRIHSFIITLADRNFYYSGIQFKL